MLPRHQSGNFRFPVFREDRDRELLLEVLLYLCRGRYTLTSLGKRLGKISVSGLAKARQLMDRRVKTDDGLRKRVDRIQHALFNVEDSSS